MSWRSQGRNNGLRAPSASRSTRVLDSAWAISTKPTDAPCAKKASTIAAPMPEPPPVMKTTRSRRLGYWAKDKTNSFFGEMFVSLRSGSELVDQPLGARVEQASFAHVD